MRSMRRMHFAAVLALAACGPSASQGPAASHTTPGGESGSDVVCREETPTGSSISREVCRSRAQMDADRKNAEDFMRTPGPAPRRR
jgi:hypothetical protein